MSESDWISEMDRGQLEAAVRAQKLQLELSREGGAQKDAEIQRLKTLLTSAADALEDSLPMKQYASSFKLPYYDLIAELRKAAG